MYVVCCNLSVSFVECGYDSHGVHAEVVLRYCQARLNNAGSQVTVTVLRNRGKIIKDEEKI